MSVKISELPILDSLADNDVIAGVDTSANVTSKIEMATLKNYIDTNTQYTAGKNINITDNVISAPFVYDKTQTNALLDDFKDETNALIEDLETSVNEQLEEKDEQIEELQSEVDSLSTIFNAFPTESGEGESVTLDDTAEVKFKKFDLKGNTSQTTYSGKNLLNNTLLTTTVTKNGITATPHSDGSITFNGTATTLSFFNLSQQDFGENAFNSETGGTGLYVATNGGTLRMAYDPSNHYTYIQVNNGASLTNVIAYPMIRLKTITDDTYEPYVGGTASPNPDFPQPVNVVSGDNEIEVCGKNLFDINNAYHGTINASGVLGPNESFRTSDYITTVPNTQYYFSTTQIVGQTNKQIYIAYYDSSKTFISRDSYNELEHLFTTPTNCYFMRAGVFTANQENVMLGKDSTTTTYEPYQGNTYNIDLPVENLFPEFSIGDRTQSGLEIKRNSDNTLLIRGTSTAVVNNWINNLNISLNSGTYTFSTNYDLGGKVTIVLKDSNSQNIAQFNSGKSATLSINETTIFNQMLVQVASGVTIDNSFTFQLEKSSKANTYTPYGTTPIELCKIGNYQDYFYKDSGKWYLHKEIGKVVLNGSESWTYALQSNVSRFDITIPNAVSGSATNNPILSTHFKTEFALVDKRIFLSGYGNTIGIMDNDFSNTNDFKNWLSSNNVTCYYGYTTPTAIEVEYQPLIDQLNLLEKAISYDSQTNIIQVNNDLGFIIYAEAIKSLENVLDRLALVEE